MQLNCFVMFILVSGQSLNSQKSIPEFSKFCKGQSPFVLQFVFQIVLNATRGKNWKSRL